MSIPLSFGIALDDMPDIVAEPACLHHGIGRHPVLIVILVPSIVMIALLVMTTHSFHLFHLVLSCLPLLSYLVVSIILKHDG